MVRTNVHAKIWFDREVIRRDWSKINRTPITRAGNLVRKIARGSIRTVNSANPSPVGTPPRSRSKQKQFKLIFSVPNAMGTTVVVGMVGFNSVFDSVRGIEPVPGLHEHSGTAKTNIEIRTFTRRTGKRGRPKIIRSARKTRTSRRVRYPKRPFMIPALMKARSKLPHLWKNTIR